MEKILLITRYVIPHFLYGLVIGKTTITLLEELDHAVKQRVKSILHSHASTTDGLLYYRKRDGGIGLPRIKSIVSIAELKSWYKMSNSYDITAREVSLSPLLNQL